MKKQLILFFGVLAVLSLKAQSTFSVDKDTVYMEGYANQDEIVANNSITNDTRIDITLKWVRINEEIGAWDGSQICDNQTCYASAINETPANAPYTIKKDSTANLDVHFKPNNNEGDGVVHLKVWNVTDTSDAKTIVYIAKAEGFQTSVADMPKTNDIKVYPNPAKDFLYLRDLPVNKDVNVEIYNILGRKILSESFSYKSSTNEQRIDINELQKGIYLVRVFDGQMNLLSTRSISKMK